MYEDRRIVALIPARGGSKGIPGKNIKEFNSHPLIAYTIYAALKSCYIDEVVVTTDSEKIAQISRQYGAEVPFLRPPELAADSSRTIDAVVHAVDKLESLGQEFDDLVLLQATSPLRCTREIDEALETYFSHGMLGLASVSDVSENPVLIRRLDETSGVLHPILPVSSTVRRQDMPKYYRVNGAIYINRVDEISPNTSFNDNPIAYVMEKIRSCDIDSLDDFVKAEAIMCELKDPQPESKR